MSETDGAAGAQTTGGSAPTNKHETGGAIVVGVIEGQNPVVVRTAARYALDLGCPLVVAHVDPDQYLLGEFYEPTATPLAVLPEVLSHEPARFRTALHEQVEAALEASRRPGEALVEWEAVALTGDPATALSDLADARGARMIVVGTREHGVLAGIAEFLAGSVAVHLAHRQHRPVLVVPLDDERSASRRAPWEVEE